MCSCVFLINFLLLPISSTSVKRRTCNLGNFFLNSLTSETETLLARTMIVVIDGNDGKIFLKI